MEVNVLPGSQSKLARAFIVCDKRDDIGRVPVNLAILEEWHASHEMQQCEAMLFNQAQALQSIFTNLACQAQKQSKLVTPTRAGKKYFDENELLEQQDEKRMDTRATKTASPAH